VVYLYAPGRGAEHATRPLAGFNGVLQVDAYAAYNALADPARAGGPVTLAYCWSHVRRHFYEIAQGGNAPIAEEALAHIAALSGIERTIRGQTPEQRRTVRLDQARPLIRQPPPDAGSAGRLEERWFRAAVVTASAAGPARAPMRPAGRRRPGGRDGLQEDAPWAATRSADE
jgi:hypothetical protein